MYRFNVSAPGTVLLCGKRNETCIAASLDRRTRLTFSSFPTYVVKRDIIEINFTSIKFYVRIPLDTFLRTLYKKKYTGLELYRKVKTFVTYLNDVEAEPYFYDLSNPAHRLSLEAFFFLLTSISYKETINIKATFCVEVSTELPIGQGLGSSASFVICLAACFFRWSLLQKGIVRYEFQTEDLSSIINYAQTCDNIIYNSSIPIDILISAYGQIKVFERNIMTTRSFPHLPSMEILLVHSNVTRKVNLSIKEKVIEHLPASVNFVSNSIGTITTTFIQTLLDIDVKTRDLKQDETINADSIGLINDYEKLLDLIHINQGLLRALGTSHPNLDIICAIARNFSFAGKISNRGGGGFAFILLLPNSTVESIQPLIEMLHSHKFLASRVSLNCSGLIVE